MECDKKNKQKKNTTCDRKKKSKTEGEWEKGDVKKLTP